MGRDSNVVMTDDADLELKKIKQTQYPIIACYRLVTSEFPILVYMTVQVS